jgi:hypothetical protein
MSSSGVILIGAPASIALLALLLRHAPAAILTLIAGSVVLLAGEKRAIRALAVLTALRRPTRRTAGVQERDGLFPKSP